MQRELSQTEQTNIFEKATFRLLVLHLKMSQRSAMMGVFVFLRPKVIEKINFTRCLIVSKLHSLFQFSYVEWDVKNSTYRTGL